jgi:hypothetical protein
LIVLFSIIDFFFSFLLLLLLLLGFILEELEAVLDAGEAK